MRKAVTFAIFFCFVFSCHKTGLLAKPIGVTDPDVFRNVSTLISSKGYPVEDHTVQTSDGFILSLQRIPHGRNGNSDGGAKKQVVFLQHGLMTTSADWVINFPKQSLGFLLADEGYDVWMGNTRGNTYSRRHVKYSPRDPEFWDFSFDEMAQYDLPAMIDYVLIITGEQQLTYIGHSQGTTVAFALLSESPEYNKKIKQFIAMAPVTTVSHMTSVIRYLCPFAPRFDNLLESVGVNEVFPMNRFMRVIGKLMCDAPERMRCDNFLFTIVGADSMQLNETRLDVYSALLVGGASTKNFVHFAQLVTSGLFAKFDYGREGNMDHCNQPTPPEYDVSRITTPVSLFWSLNDKLVSPADVDILQGKLKSLEYSYCVPFPQFNHVDYLIAVDAFELLYKPVIALLNQH